MDSPKRQLKTVLRRLASLASQFDGSQGSINSIHSVMENMDPSILQHFLPGPFTRLVSPILESRESTSGIRYADIYKDDHCLVNTFGLLKSGLKIPLHDHPNQNAVMKVYQGSVAIRSFTLVNQNLDSTNRSILVEYEGELILSSKSDQQTAVLGPKKGNIHEVVSLEPHTYFCDFFFPNTPECFYYRPDRPIETFTIGQEITLIRTRCPRDFFCDPMNFPSFPEFDL
uniref:2-aminoethanethiol dioxygenase n=1 Tax=Caenorhabditis tropicalis TaxID=1561998 RepID=A0A1I7TYM2_9PELO